MPFTIRPYRRFPVQCSVTYHASLFQGRGTVWNLSRYGWRVSGNLPLRVGQTCSLTVSLPNHQSVFVASVIVRWVRDDEYGLETLITDETDEEHIAHYIRERARESVQPIP